MTGVPLIDWCTQILGWWVLAAIIILALVLVVGALSDATRHDDRTWWL